jgi:hypothetical protein
MAELVKQKRPTDQQVTVQEVNRVLEVGRLLLSVLSKEELEELRSLLAKNLADTKIGNVGVT